MVQTAMASMAHVASSRSLKPPEEGGGWDLWGGLLETFGWVCRFGYIFGGLVVGNEEVFVNFGG